MAAALFPTYVLVSGAGGDPWYWHRVVPLLRGHGDVAAVDLPGADDRAGLDAYADVIAEAIGDREDAVVVAQSMGALSAPLVHGRADVRAFVLVAPMIPLPGVRGGEWWSASGQREAKRALDSAEGRDPDAPFDPIAMFLHDLPPDVLEAALARGDVEQCGRPFADPWPLDAWPDVPTDVIAGRHDRLLPLAFLTRLAEAQLGVTPRVVDSGHLPALSRPAELVDLIRTSPAVSAADLRAAAARATCEG